VRSAVGPNGKTYLASGGSIAVPVSVKSPSSGDMTYWVDVQCAA
jgi:hypothetical protein